MKLRILLLAFTPALFVCDANGASRRAPTNNTPVRATLADGQILMGEVQTRTLSLISGSGTLEIPLADVGEVVPATGGQLGEAEGRVDVWLRNGSELRGTWANPKLAMSIQVGGSQVPLDLPMNELARFQLQGNARWPGGPVYRMKTRFGDDFLVDPAKTQLVLENDLGTFSPMLSECAYVAPVDDPQGLWRVQLQTGTVLLGHLKDDKVTVALPMGPSEVSVPLDSFVSLKIERWSPVATRTPVSNVYPQERPVQDLSPGVMAGLPVDPQSGYYDRTVQAAPTQVYTEQAEVVRGESSSLRMPSRARPSMAAPAPVAVEDEAAPAAEEWFDSSSLAETKKAQE
ncbi:MAG TPA: hypothetical protein PKY30_02555 [Myxococcota bacterium]|nr:hypothetical protein [Myxococcota bacterium]HNH45887.1 hypothetical protein [Myxococcota bacterium]